MAKEYFTTKELCEFLKISKNQPVKLRKMGLPYIKVGGMIRYDKDEVQKWLKKHEETVDSIENTNQ